MIVTITLVSTVPARALADELLGAVGDQANWKDSNAGWWVLNGDTDVWCWSFPIDDSELEYWKSGEIPDKPWTNVELLKQAQEQLQWFTGDVPLTGWTLLAYVGADPLTNFFPIMNITPKPVEI